LLTLWIIFSLVFWQSFADEISTDRIAERGTVISFMGGEQVYIVVNKQPEQIFTPKSWRQRYDAARSAESNGYQEPVWQ